MMKNLTYDPFTVALLMLVFAAATTVAYAQTFSVLYNFGTNAGDPANPYFSGNVAQGRDGNLYSTTPSGGANGAGAVFKITPTGKLTVLYSFTGGSDGANPTSGLTLGTDGNFYGTTLGGGAYSNGTIFKISPAGEFKTLHSFNADGSEPVAGLVQGTDGRFYGTTLAGGANGDGTVFKITPAGTLTTIHSFKHYDGAGSTAVLVQGTDGKFYGTTNTGGMYGYGTVFRITSGGTLTLLHSFTCGGDGCVPVAGLVQGTDGKFYGTSREGGANGDGTVFKITPAGTLTTLHDFSGADGEAPFGGLLQATDGNFYGTASSGGTLNDGTIFRISPQQGYSVLYNFDSSTGSTPFVTPFEHTNGVVYGDTYLGGTGNVYPCTMSACGTFYRLNVGLKAFVSLVSTSGKVGKTIGILGQGLKGTTGVSFNGTIATFKVISSTYLTAVVPNGATTGFVTVTTPKSKLKSNKKFRIIT